ncbi:hypothetical protein PV325_004610 [Microctonus aethiopoides]|nr:hypothetical protein PV325_004610 [Microctonus aethiopoides]
MKECNRGIVVSSATTNGIPVGIAVARQRLQHQETSSTSMRNVSLSHHTSHHASYHHFQPDTLAYRLTVGVDELFAGSTTAMAMGGTTLLHCGTGGDDRTSHLTIPSGALAPSINAATLHSGLSNIGPGAPSAWPPTLWQYPTTAMSPLEPIGFPQIGVGLQGGLQLVRDPTTGQLLLIHAVAEQMQQAVVWPNYSNHTGTNVGAASSPLLLPGPTPPSLQLLNDINGARLVLTENKRKHQHNAMPIVKIEADCASPNTTIIASAESNKSLQTVTTMTGSIVPDPPLLTTLHYYPHAPALVQISHAESTQCRTQRNTFISKPTSPVSCLTPPPEITNAISGIDRNNVLAVQDASNQTDAPDIDDHFSVDGFIKQEQIFSACNQSVLATCVNFNTVSSSIERSRTPNNTLHSSPNFVINKINESVNIDGNDSHVVNNIEESSLIDQTIERVVSCKSNLTESSNAESASIIEDNNKLEKKIPRFGSRLIEITEENCDSFHENLEFFGRRHEPSEELYKSNNSEEEILNQQKIVDKIIISPLKNDEINVNEPDTCHSISSTIDDTSSIISLGNENETKKICDIVKPFSEPLKSYKIASICPEEIENNDNELQIINKSLDMPSIDCDEQHQTEINVKRELDELISPIQPHSMELDDANNISEKLNNSEKKQCADKFHPGIENVVEKLKKNAAAAALQDHQIVENSIDVNNKNDDFHSGQQSIANCQSIKLGNGLKKRILQSCEATLSLENASAKQNDDINSLNTKYSGINNNITNNINHGEKNASSSVVNKQKSNDSFEPVSNSDVDSAKGKQKSNVDLSGLELLSNSIAQLEQLKPNESLPINENIQDQKESNNNNVDSPLGLLCALAEQRFMEEVGQNVPKRSVINYENPEELSNAGILLLNLRKVTELENSKNERIIIETAKKIDDEDTCSDVEKSQNRTFEMFKFGNKNCNDTVEHNVINYSRECEADDADDDCTDSETEVIKNKSQSKIYHNIESENFVISDDQIKSVDKIEQINRDNNWSHGNMNAMELHMREKLADIQKKYKEKQMELSKLSPRKDDGKCLGKSRKKSFECDYLSIDNQQQNIINKSLIKFNEENDSTSNSIECTVDMSKSNTNLVKLDEPRSHIKLLDSIPNVSLAIPPQTTSTIAFSPDDNINSDNESNNSVMMMSSDAVSPTLSIPLLNSASKKRKVGRPRKFMSTSTSARHLTETIVSKKSRTKSSLISYLLNSKNRQQCKFNSKTNQNSKGISKANNKSTKSKVKSIKHTQLHNKNVICSIIAEKAKLSQEAKLEKKIMKLKPTINDEITEKSNDFEINKQFNYSLNNISNEKDEVEKIHQSPEELLEKSSSELIIDEEKCEKIKKKKRKSTSSSSPLRHKVDDNDRKLSKRRKSSDCRECKECARAAKAENLNNIVNRCKLTSEHLSNDQMRVLTAMGGLFYAGRLSAVQAPDIYAITLDGERGNRPHIHSREEILQDAIVEVCPKSTKELPPGTRLCAYWSQQYRCLYPGTSVEPSEPDSELDDKFVSVEFDDGDSGKIALQDIRLLQPDYPVVEYDPNPLLTLGKKRRQTSTSTDDKRLSNESNLSVKSINSTSIESTSNLSMINVNNNADNVRKIDGIDDKTLDEYRERKKLKKRRRDKLKRLQDAALFNDGKRKHRKHKCCEEHRKHKHRKHRKHKRRHSHHASHSEASHFSGGDSCSGHFSEGDNINESAIAKDKNTTTINNKLNDNDDDDDDNDLADIVSLTELPQTPELIHDEQMPIVKVDKVKKSDKKLKSKERQDSVENRSKMAAFLPARQLWGWSGKGYRRPGAKGRAKKQFFKAIQRGSEAIQIGDSAVFLSTGRPDRPYIGKIESMWETTNSNMVVKVKWFYHPEETVGAPANLKYPGALFESPHMDENDVQTISHKCEVLPLHDYTIKLEKEPHRYLTIYDHNDIYYLAGYYDPTTYLLTLQPDVV